MSQSKAISCQGVSHLSPIWSLFYIVMITWFYFLMILLKRLYLQNSEKLRNMMVNFMFQLGGCLGRHYH